MARLLWTLKQHVGPSPRVRHAAGFDTIRLRTVLFGGDSLRGALLADTWEWDGESWTQLNDIGPSARHSAAMAHAADRRRTVLFGGRNADGALGDTWEWNGEDWTQLADTGPAARSGHRMVFDTARNVVVLFGGAAGEAVLGDTWEWNGDEWVQVADAGPQPRRSHAMAYDAGRQRSILFGGTNGTATLGDTWEFDGINWRQIAAFGAPPAFDSTLIHSGRGARLFGGVSAVAANPDVFRFTWEWDGRHWTVRQDMGPGNRWGHSMVFDTGRNRGVLFGGSASVPGTGDQAASGETWEQFEQGAAAPDTSPDGPPDDQPDQPPDEQPEQPPNQPPAGGAGILGIEITPVQPVEGEPMTLVVRVANAAAGMSVSLTIEDLAGFSLIGAPIDLPVDAGATMPIQSLRLPAGMYNLRASIGQATMTKTVSVTIGAIQLVALGVNPPAAAAGQPFTVTATLDAAPTTSGLGVPLRIDFQGQPSGLWLGEQLVVAPGATSGAITVDPAVFGAGGQPIVGELTFRASLGGSERSATVTLQ